MDIRRSFARPHSELDLVEVVIGEFASRQALGELSHYLFLGVEEERADTVQLAFVEVAAVGGLVEDRPSSATHETHALYVTLPAHAVVQPLALVYRNTVHTQSPPAPSHSLPELALVDATVLIYHAALAPSHTVSTSSLVLHLGIGSGDGVLTEGSFEFQEKLAEYALAAEVNCLGVVPWSLYRHAVIHHLRSDLDLFP